MFDIQNYASFVAAIVIFQLIPGPGTLAILNATARNGVGAGMGAVIGTLIGDFVYMIAAILGLAAVMKMYPILFQGLQWFGAAYLCWMGIQLLRTPIDASSQNSKPRQSAWVFFRQAFAVSLTNPKVVLFFVAFFPLFLRPDASSTTLAAMIAHVTLISLVYQAGLVLIGNLVARQLAAWPFARKLATRLAGIALVGFGVKLALNNR
ncbi:LysE family translocator [Parachitinimonas caeni]|uniref:LysE family translocator n=1 Tax=Parachitinimonas caeni TaxID=3031301 RepID=A0ABT7DXU7_9NEIS|nr:LysE family translocator [Parachitinimonas caeni]MDK2123908.1 LysE family translocator [Parachitinimonas caeni]